MQLNCTKRCTIQQYILTEKEKGNYTKNISGIEHIENTFGIEHMKSNLL